MSVMSSWRGWLREGRWHPVMGRLLDGFGEGVSWMAGKLREAAEEELFVKSARSGRSYAHPGIVVADVEVWRAALLLARLFEMASKVAPRKGRSVSWSKGLRSWMSPRSLPRSGARRW